MSDQTGVAVVIGGVVLIVLGGWLYWHVYLLPWHVAKKRNHAASRVIFWFTVFLGWTLLGWTFALIWAFEGQVIEPGTSPFTLRKLSPSEEWQQEHLKKEKEFLAVQHLAEEREQIIAVLRVIADNTRKA